MSETKWTITHDASDAFDTLLSEAGDRFFEVAFRIARMDGPAKGPIPITKDHVCEAFGRFKIGGAQAANPQPPEVQRPAAPATAAPVAEVVDDEEGCCCDDCHYAKPDDDEAEDNEGNVYSRSNPMGLPAAPAAVITGPGKYQEFWPEAAEPQVATIYADIGFARFIGIDSFGRPDIWTVLGLPERYDGVRITGPYVEPPPKPVLTITDERHERGWVYAWTKVEGQFPQVKGMSVTSHAEDVGEMIRAGRHVYVHENGPLVVCEADWPRVLELVAMVNKAAPCTSAAG